MRLKHSVLPMHVPVKRIWGAQDHFYSSKSIRLEVLIFNINNQRGLSRMDGHVFEDQHRAILNKKEQTNFKKKKKTKERKKEKKKKSVT